MSGSKGRVELYVDPCCPFAWIAYQWLAEVRRHRAVELGLHLMSLPMLNEHQPISLGYRRLLSHTWGPARVAAATVRQHGPDALEALYEAMARRIFAGADHYRVIREDLDSVIVDAVSEVGLPVGLADAAANGAYDGSLRVSHNAAMAPMGSGVGTPIIHLGTAAFFGLACDDGRSPGIRSPAGVRRPATACRLSPVIRDQASAGGQPRSRVHRARPEPARIHRARRRPLNIASARSS